MNEFDEPPVEVQFSFKRLLRLVFPATVPFFILLCECELLSTSPQSEDNLLLLGGEGEGSGSGLGVSDGMLF